MPFVLGIRPGVAFALHEHPELVDALRDAQARCGLIAEELESDSQAAASYEALRLLGLNSRLAVGSAGMFSHAVTDGSIPYPVTDHEHTFFSADLGSGDVSIQLA